MSLEEYRHPVAGFTLPLPSGWECIEDPQYGVPVIAVEPVDTVGFRANVVVTSEALPPGCDLGVWQANVDELLPQELPHYSLIDREFIDGGDRRFFRRLAHYVGDDTGSVTMEQWAVIASGTGFTLTASVATFAYDSLADMFADMALRFRPDGVDGIGEVTA
ncbi:hypothetical protein [Stackebrandtia soli]|uniref:hypothetical protein n=1 Tax=Stackebrandtia soli TaxID=1892856 RepID=UPI0039E9E179